jgi:hypothetical protein
MSPHVTFDLNQQHQQQQHSISHQLPSYLQPYHPSQAGPQGTGNRVLEPGIAAEQHFERSNGQAHSPADESDQQDQDQQQGEIEEREAEAEAEGEAETEGEGEVEVEVEVDPDWRDQIYYWMGELSFDPAHSWLVWRGLWLPSFTGRPSMEEFGCSSYEFAYYGDPVSQWEVLPGPDGLLRPKSGYFRGYYMMDGEGAGEGDGGCVLEKYLDNQYYVEFEEVRGLDPPRYTVVGKGDSDFGTFILTGTYNAGSRVLEMARQYISETDERRDMDIPQLKRFFASAAAAAAAAAAMSPPLA